MTTIVRDSDDPYSYHIDSVDVNKVANQAKSVPIEWITPSGNDVTPELVRYIRPLIQGESYPEYSDGLPVYMNISHLV